ncbi:MAG: hypothetical protein ACKVS6_10440 [Planctomycetota bacterium]
MAFDLNTFLQENKKYLMGSFVGAAVFLAAYAIIDSFVWDEIRSAKREVSTIDIKRKKEEFYSQKNYDEAAAIQQKLDESITTIIDRLKFIPRPEFQLKDGGASPANQYLDIATKFRDKRGDDARSRGIVLIESAGIPDRAPTQPDDIRRTLVGIDLIDRVLGFAIESGARAIDRIVITTDTSAVRAGSAIREEIKVEFEMEFTSRALSQFLEMTQATIPPLTIDDFRSTLREAQSGGRAGRGESLIQVFVRFAALDAAAPKE